MSDVPLLAQQELLEPAPRRRLIVPVFQTAWWGVDPGVRRVAVAYVAPDGSRGASTASFANLEGGARLAEIWRETRSLVAERLLCDEQWPAPGLVMVEQPSGKQPNPALSYATGVIQGAIYDALAVHVGPTRIETCASSWWKARATGRGDLYKPKPGGGQYGVLTWAQQNGYKGSSWDEADAWGIAEAARREVALEQR